MRPPAPLLQQLATSRLMPLRTQPAGGIGARRSRKKGAGMEFIDHRPYQDGDDIRHLDPYVLARSGDTVVRQYAQYRQLPVTVVVDASTSMDIGGKAALAYQIAQALAFVSLAAGDRVQIVVCSGNSPRWSPRWQGAARAEPMFAWVAQQPVGGPMTFAEALRLVPRNLAANGYLILISDWWDAEAETALDALQSAGHEALAIQILAPEEYRPDDLGTGVMTMADAETGDEAEILLDGDTIGRFIDLVATWRADLAKAFSARQWPFVSIDTDTDIADFFQRTLRARGILT